MTNHTVELGDIEQLQELHGYKVIERLPVVLIENAELLQRLFRVLLPGLLCCPLSFLS